MILIVDQHSPFSIVSWFMTRSTSRRDMVQSWARGMSHKLFCDLMIGSRISSGHYSIRWSTAALHRMYNGSSIIPGHDRWLDFEANHIQIYGLKKLFLWKSLYCISSIYKLLSFIFAIKIDMLFDWQYAWKLSAQFYSENSCDWVQLNGSGNTWI